MTEPLSNMLDKYAPKTALVAKLMELSNAAIAKGMPLMTAEEISEELARRRGGNDASMIEEPKITYITRCPVCNAKLEWDESGTKVTAQTPAELAAENTLCNAAYLAKKPE